MRTTLLMRPAPSGLSSAFWVVCGKRLYEVTWQDFDKEHNTHEPKEHLIECTLLLPFWRAKKNKVQLERLTKLHEAVLFDRVEADAARRSRHAKPLQPEEESAPHTRPRSSDCAALLRLPTATPQPADATDEVCRAA